jgi:hypothetical protein
MKKQTKKLIAIIVIAAMAASMMTFSALGSGQTDSGAGIEFDAGTLPTGIVCPSDPTIPTLPSQFDDLESMDLYFGINEVPLADVTYFSNITANGYSTADITVWAHLAANWRVDVNIGMFTSTTGINSLPTPQQTLIGFELTLVDVDYVVSPSTQTITSHNTVTISEATTSAPTILVGDQGIAGARWAGQLEVFANSAHVGEAEAELTWYYVVL